MDVFTRPFVYIIGIFLTLVVVFNIYMAKMDNDAQSYCNDAIEEFVDKSRSSGYISPESYLTMARRVNNTGNLYELEIVHQSKTTVPLTNPDGTNVVDADGNIVSDTTYSYNSYNKEDILTILFPNDPNEDYGRYDLKNGDYLKVSLNLKEPTLAARLYSKWSGTQLKTIAGSYGGYVGSTGDAKFY